MRIQAVQRSDWREYRQIRLAALKESPSAFASTWQEEASLAPHEWRERAYRSQAAETLTIVVAVDDAGRWVGLAGGYRPGDRGADAELISMWVVPECRGHRIGPELVRAIVAWAQGHGASTIGLWVNAANRPAISLYDKAGFRRTGEVDKLPSDPTQREIACCEAPSGKVRETGLPRELWNRAPCRHSEPTKMPLGCATPK